MIGRQVIIINRALTLEELGQFMQENWDTEQFGPFQIGKPTKASLEEYILLPATQRFLVIVYPRKAGGLFSKENKIVLSVADTPEGAHAALFEYMPSKGPITKLWQTSQVLSADKERKGPAEQALQTYTAYMKELLEREGWIK